MLMGSYSWLGKLATIGKPGNVYLFSIVDKTHHGSVIASFPAEFFSHAGIVLLTKIFSCN